MKTREVKLEKSPKNGFHFSVMGLPRVAPILRLFLLLLFTGQLRAQIYETNIVVQPFVGSGFFGYLDGQGTATMFDDPTELVADTQGNLFVVDSGNDRIRKVTPSGTVSTFAGGGFTSPPGNGTNVNINSWIDAEASMSIDRSNTLWIANPSFNLLLRIGADANVSTWALSPALNGVKGICVDSMNNLYLSGGNKIYQVKANSHTVEVFAGSGNPGAVDGNWVFTSFNDPSGLGVDAADNIYVWDASNSFLRRINQNKDVETIAGKSGNQSDGTGANIVFGLISSMHFDTFGNLIFSSANAVRKMSPTTNVTTFAGSFNQTGYTNGAGPVARFNNARGVALVQGAIYVCDKVNHRIRKIMFDPAEVPVMGANLELNTHPVVKITGIVGRSYRIESSTNMSTWTPETTILLTRTPYLWFDQAPANTKKFYRAFLLP